MNSHNSLVHTEHYLNSYLASSFLSLGSHKLLQHLLDCHQEMVQWEFQERDSEGNTLLHFLVHHQHLSKLKAIEVAKILIQSGLNPHLTDKQGTKVLDLLPQEETMAKVVQERLDLAKKGKLASGGQG